MEDLMNLGHFVHRLREIDACNIKYSLLIFFYISGVQVL